MPVRTQPGPKATHSPGIPPEHPIRRQAFEIADVSCGIHQPPAQIPEPRATPMGSVHYAAARSLRMRRHYLHRCRMTPHRGVKRASPTRRRRSVHISVRQRDNGFADPWGRRIAGDTNFALSGRWHADCWGAACPHGSRNRGIAGWHLAAAAYPGTAMLLNPTGG